MQIVTDSGADLALTREERDALAIHVVPLSVTLTAKSFREGEDISADDFYRMLAETNALPTTSQPSAGDFAEVYRQLAVSDPDILSVHISSGLSGTLNAARAGAAMVPEARVTHVDSHTLSAATGWQVQAAALAARAGATTDQICAMLDRVAAATSTFFTLEDLRYLIHGGRISHMKALVASLLRLKPMIGVDKVTGAYVQHGQARAFPGALRGMVNLMLGEHPAGSSLRVQVLHAGNPDGAQHLHTLIDEQFNCHWLPTGPISFVLGAHTGPSLVGVCFAGREDLGGAL